jgi:16S rRNA (adenine(1408)-N(1))-methyltransferase
LPAWLEGRADEVTIQFPWASLLRGTLALDPAVAAGIARLLAPGGRVTALVATAAHDRLAGVPTAVELLDGARPALADRWSGYGLHVAAVRTATEAEVAAARSSWGRRLRGRAVARIELEQHDLMLSR